MGEIPPRHIAPFPQRQLHGDPAIVYRRAALVRLDLDDDTRRSRLRLGRAHIGDLQGVSGWLLWVVHSGQRGALHSCNSHRVSDDDILQPKGDCPMSGRNMVTDSPAGATPVLATPARKTRTISARKF